MKISESIDKLLPALHEARKAITPAGKSGKNTFDRYDYANELDWHNAIQPALAANGLVLVFSADEATNLPERATKKGGVEHIVQVTGSAHLFHTSGQWMQVYGVGQGQDRGDKGVYKAMTGMKKYLYALMFSLPTTDDPENASPGGGDRAAPPEKPASKPTKPGWELEPAKIRCGQMPSCGALIKHTDEVLRTLPATDKPVFLLTASAVMTTMLQDVIQNDAGDNLGSAEGMVAGDKQWVHFTDDQRKELAEAIETRRQQLTPT